MANHKLFWYINCMTKRRKIMGLVFFILLAGSAIAVYFWLVKDNNPSAPKPAEKIVYTEDTAKKLNEGTCGDAEYNELEKLYQQKLDDKDPLNAARIRLDQYSCAVFNNNNPQALGLLDDAKKIYEQNNRPADLEQVNSSIEFINARIERGKNPIKEKTEDQEGGS